MNYKQGSNQYRVKHKYLWGLKSEAWASVWFIAFLTVILLPLTRHTIISPLSDRPIISVQAAEPEPTELQKITNYIVQKFQPEGRGVATRALSCFISESGLRPDAYNWNTNNTADVGIAQINDVHHMSVEERKDWKKNIDRAYQIYKKHGWKAWYGKGCK